MTQTHAARLTVDEFERLLALPDYQDRRIELINGEMVEAMPNSTHASLAFRLAFLLGTYLAGNPIGVGLVEPRVQMASHSLIPDVAFVSAARAALIIPDQALSFVPDLCIEIASPGQPLALLSQKAAFYLAHGGRMVWLIYPDRGIVEWLTRDGRDLLTGQMAIDGGDVLPGLALTAGEVVG
jgi:Uma2 family endonuclease